MDKSVHFQNSLEGAGAGGFLSHPFARKKAKGWGTGFFVTSCRIFDAA
jgi:hypothetical protein